MMSRFASLLAALLLVLFATGAFYSTNEDRPFYSLGQLHTPLGILASLLAVFLILRLCDSSRWVLLAALLAEAALGFQPDPQPPAIRFLHDLIAQVLFSAAVAAAMASSASWERPHQPLPDPRKPSLRNLAIVAGTLLTFQVILGTAFRHGILGILPHILGAFVIVLTSTLLAMIALQRPEYPKFHPVAITVIVVTFLQVLLGFTVYIMQIVETIDPVLVMLATAAHTVVSALTVAATAALILLIWRDTPVPDRASPVSA